MVDDASNVITEQRHKELRAFIVLGGEGSEQVGIWSLSPLSCFGLLLSLGERHLWNCKPKS